MQPCLVAWFIALVFLFPAQAEETSIPHPGTRLDDGRWRCSQCGERG